MFKALANGSRRKRLDQLQHSNGQTLGERCARLVVTGPAVTKHLRLLAAASLVAVVRRWREQLHRLNLVPIHEITGRRLDKSERPRRPALGARKKGLEENETNKKG